ncbi:hypothetical protein LHK_03142 [Laribacter hongkongensis HLHK9]|uniref:Uncharacterized protein n=1 Tax=Laribacter hongkongensis (strain HLHK9) TaxID=557598 RepID=C1D685_LARHH|nr:hypothetical protein [Laribacter hongkongensis]ACO76120.1 hypothetical protein LHK_03142 [Laribacter hongkongensis HLHK9]
MTTRRTGHAAGFIAADMTLVVPGTGRNTPRPARPVCPVEDRLTRNLPERIAMPGPAGYRQSWSPP